MYWCDWCIVFLKEFCGVFGFVEFDVGGCKVVGIVEECCFVGYWVGI